MPVVEIKTAINCEKLRITSGIDYTCIVHVANQLMMGGIEKLFVPFILRYISFL